jgi:hypothetical protein
LAATHAVRDARPDDPRDLAKLLRWIVKDQEDLFQEPLGAILKHVAQQLEGMADATTRLGWLRSVLDRYPMGQGIMIDRDYLAGLAEPPTSSRQPPAA